MGHLKDFLAGFPDKFNKNEDNSIGKLLTIASDQMDDITNALLTTEEWRSIDNAEGTTLDLLGDDNNLKRGKSTDNTFRIRIRGKQARINSDGTINKIIQAIVATLNRQFSDIKVENGYEISENKNAFLAISIKKNPNDYEMPLDELESVVSGGIGIRWEYVIETDYELNGSFSEILYLFEFYCGWMTPDGEQQTNGNLDVITQFEFSGTPTIILQSPYPIAGDYEQINDNASILNQFNLSSLNSVMLQDCYPICGTFVAGEVV